MNALEANKAERCQHENADARAEVAAIDRYRELKENGAPDCLRGDVLFGSFGPAAETSKGSLRQENDCREEDQKRDEPGEGFLAGMGEKDTAEQAADDANGNEAPEPWFHGIQTVSVSKDAAGGAKDQGEGAGGVGDDRWCAEE